MDKAAAILANFGADDGPVLGKAVAHSQLPFELPSSMQAVEAQDPAVPDDSASPLFNHGFGIISKSG